MFCCCCLDNSVGGRSDGSQVDIVLQEVLFQFGQNVFAVSVLAQRGNVRSDFVHEQFALRWLRHVDHLLHNIIGVLERKKLLINHSIKLNLTKVLYLVFHHSV